MGDTARLRRVLDALVPVLVPLLVAAAGAAVLAASAPAPGYRFRASSAWDDYPRSGWTGHVRRAAIFVHTRKEKRPWVEIELSEPRTVSRVTVRSRRDQPDRGLPLVLEVREEDGTFRELARREKKFGSHTFRFGPVVASTLRLRVDSSRATFLHLEHVHVD